MIAYRVFYGQYEKIFKTNETLEKTIEALESQLNSN